MNCQMGILTSRNMETDTYNVRPQLDSLVGGHNSNNYGLWYLQRTSYWGESKPTNITGAPHRS